MKINILFLTFISFQLNASHITTACKCAKFAQLKTQQKNNAKKVPREIEIVALSANSTADNKQSLSNLKELQLSKHFINKV